jgi:hypothetical protein
MDHNFTDPTCKCLVLFFELRPNADAAKVRDPPQILARKQGVPFSFHSCFDWSRRGHHGGSGPQPYEGEHFAAKNVMKMQAKLTYVSRDARSKEGGEFGLQSNLKLSNNKRC